MVKETQTRTANFYNLGYDEELCLAVVSFSRRGLTVRTADSKSARVGSTPTASAISFYNLLQLNNLQSIINSFLDAHSKLDDKKKILN